MFSGARHREETMMRKGSAVLLRTKFQNFKLREGNALLWADVIALEPLEIEAGMLISPKLPVDYNVTY